jgi:hypothetical protein
MANGQNMQLYRPVDYKGLDQVQSNFTEDQFGQQLMASEDRERMTEGNARETATRQG